MMVLKSKRRPPSNKLSYRILSNDNRRNKSTMGLSAALAAIIVVIIMLIGFAVYLYGIAPMFSLVPHTQSITTASQLQPGAYSLNAATNGYDHFSASTTYTAATNFNVLWDALVSGAYQEIGSNTQTIAVQPSYGGTLYAVVTIPSGQ